MRRQLRNNRPSWYHDKTTVSAPGTAEPLETLVIPDGFALVVRALVGNTGNIFLGRTKALAEDTARRLPFSKGNGLTLNIKNANLVWVDSQVVSEGVDYWVEQ